MTIHTVGEDFESGAELYLSLKTAKYGNYFNVKKFVNKKGEFEFWLNDQKVERILIDQIISFLK